VRLNASAAPAWYYKMTTRFGLAEINIMANSVMEQHMSAIRWWRFWPEWKRFLQGPFVQHYIILDWAVGIFI